MTRDEVDESMLATVGMSTEDYVKSAVDEMSLNDILLSVFGSLDLGGVYFVEDGELFMGEDWDSDLEIYPYVLDGDSITVTEEDGTQYVLTRVAEEAAE